MKQVSKEVPVKSPFLGGKPDTITTEVPSEIRGNKARARARIDAIGDTLDLVADQAKRIDMLERLVMRLSHQILNGVNMDAITLATYQGLITDYITNVDASTLTTRSDLENPLDVYTKLKDRTNAISKIIKEEYGL